MFYTAAFIAYLSFSRYFFFNCTLKFRSYNEYWWCVISMNTIISVFGSLSVVRRLNCELTS